MDIIDYKAKSSKDIWWFKGKRDLLNVLLNKYCDNKINLSILDVGCGTGEDLDIISRFGNVTIIDISKEALNLISDNLVERKILCDIQKINKDLYNKFDIVIMLDILEHIRDDDLAIDQCYKALKKDGTLIMLVPAVSRIYSAHDKALQHYRRYDKKFLFEKIDRKFKTKKIFYWNSILSLPIFLFKILRRGSKKGGTDISSFPLPKFINNFFYYTLKFENFLIKKGIHLPIGVSLIAIAKK